jgi:glycosyltransferase involved in cell wall biosynthesis
MGLALSHAAYLLFLVVSTRGAPSSTVKLDDGLQRAFQMYQGEDKDSAESLAKGLLAQEPSNPYVHNLLGMIALSHGESNKALAFFTFSNVRNKGDTVFRNNRAVSLMKLDRWKEAADIWESLLIEDPDNALFMEHLGVSLHQNAVTEFLEGIQKSNNLIKRASAMIKDVRPPAFALTEHVLALNAANILQVGAPSANLSRTLLEESGVQFAPAFKSAKLPKVLRRPLRLAVVPSDPLAAYTAKGYSDTYLTSYYNPNGFFDEVFLLSPYEKERKVQGGMVILPLCSSFDQRGSPKCSAHELVSNMKDLLYDLQVHLVRAYGGYWPCRLAANARSGNIPVVVSVHDTNPALLYKEIGDADYVLPVSVPVQRLVIKKGVAPNNVLLFTNRVDLELFRLERSKEEEASIASLKKKYPGRYRVLFVGRFYRGGNSTVAQKNWDTLLRAIPHLGPDYTFVMIGKGSEYAAQALADDLNVTLQVHFIESVSHASLPLYYAMADVFCVPSRWEGFGIVFIEALAMGSVVVTADTSPMNTFVRHNANGILVKDYNNEVELGNAIVRGATDTALREQLKRNARPSVLRYSKITVDQWEVQIYKHILSESYGGGDE